MHEDHAKYRSSPLDAVIFDLFGVMVAFDNDIVYRRLADCCADPEQAFIALDGFMAGTNVITGRQPLTMTHRILVDSLGLELSFDEFVIAWNEPYDVIMPGMSEVIDRLKPAHRVLLLSNIDTDYWQAMRPRHPEFDRFDELLISGELGLAKPDPRIFRLASERAGAPPQRCLFIDDTPRNVDAARALGMHGHVFEGTAGLEAELSRLGIPGF